MPPGNCILADTFVYVYPNIEHESQEDCIYDDVTVNIKPFQRLYIIR